VSRRSTGSWSAVDGLARTIVGVLPPDLSFRAVVPRLGALSEADMFLSSRWPRDTGTTPFSSCWAA
jgi:hypothetical protein